MQKRPRPCLILDRCLRGATGGGNSLRSARLSRLGLCLWGRHREHHRSCLPVDDVFGRDARESASPSLKGADTDTTLNVRSEPARVFVILSPTANARGEKQGRATGCRLDRSREPAIRLEPEVFAAGHLNEGAG